MKRLTVDAVMTDVPKRARRTFLSYLPTLVRGMAVEYLDAVGHLPFREAGPRQTRVADLLPDSTAFVGFQARYRPAVARATSRAAPRSRPPRALLAIAAMAFSMSSEEIHSPPDLIRSFARSAMTK